MNRSIASSEALSRVLLLPLPEDTTADIEAMIQDKRFRKALEDWVFRFDQKDARTVQGFARRLPDFFRQPRTVYRGMRVSDAVLEGAEGMTLDRYTSWSKHQNMARRFVQGKGAKKAISKTTGNPVVVRKNVAPRDVVLDIAGFFQMFAQQLERAGMDELVIEDGMSEGEVLMDKGISISSRDVVERVG